MGLTMEMRTAWPRRNCPFISSATDLPSTPSSRSCLTSLLLTGLHPGLSCLPPAAAFLSCFQSSRVTDSSCGTSTCPTLHGAQVCITQGGSYRLQSGSLGHLLSPPPYHMNTLNSGELNSLFPPLVLVLFLSVHSLHSYSSWNYTVTCTSFPLFTEAG